LKFLALAVLALTVDTGAAGAQSTERYDRAFRKYSRRFFGPAFDWRVFKAQAIAESGLDSAAASRAGARGLMQLMPSTFAQIQSKNPEFHSVDDPESNIAAGIYHARSLWRLWRSSVATPDRATFMFGSYNAGRGTILRAQQLAAARAYDPALWGSIVAVAPDVPRWRHRETLTYVSRIETNLGRLDAQGRLVRRAP
jgi:membrane-bound lytic murein transglycosylase F